MVMDEPELETRAADIIGVYLDPPVHASLFCTGEKIPHFGIYFRACRTAGG